MAKKPVKKQAGPSVKASPAQPAKAAPVAVISDSGNQFTWNKVPLFSQLSIILAALSCIVYLNSLGNLYVLDDVMVLKDNVYVKQGLKAIPEIFSTPHMRGYLVIPNDLYRPFSLAIL